MKRFENKAVIVTGGASGMGAVEARLFAAEGASVLIADVQEEKLKQVSSEIKSAGGRAIYAVHDVTSEASWKKTVRQAADTFGKVDILINNAGISGSSGPFQDTHFAEYKKIIDINLDGQYLGIQAVYPFFKQQGGGVIVNISSIVGIVAFPYTHPGYISSKGGSRLLTKSAAVSFAKQNIRVNSVHPGVIVTPMTEEMLKEESGHRAAVAAIPMGRTGRPEEVG